MPAVSVLNQSPVQEDSFKLCVDRGSIQSVTFPLGGTCHSRVMLILANIFLKGRINNAKFEIFFNL